MTARERVTVLGGLFVVCAAVFLLRVAPWAVREWSALEGRLVQRRTLVAETRRALAALPAMEDSARRLSSTVAALAPALLAGGTPEEALSDLSGRLTAIAAVSRARVEDVTPVEESDRRTVGPSVRLTVRPTFRRVTGRAVLETDLHGLARLIGTLERLRVVLVPERVSVTAAAPLAPGTMPEQLQVELVVSGWYLDRAATP